MQGPASTIKKIDRLHKMVVTGGVVPSTKENPFQPLIPAKKAVNAAKADDDGGG